MLPGWLCVSVTVAEKRLAVGDVGQAPARQVHPRIGVAAVVGEPAPPEIGKLPVGGVAVHDEDPGMAGAAAMLGGVDRRPEDGRPGRDR